MNLKTRTPELRAYLAALAVITLTAVGSTNAFAQAPARPSGDFPTNDRLDGEAPLFTITRADVARHGDRLTDGHRKLLERYSDYRMLVYPTHRTSLARHPIAFPTPQSGAEVIWNHKLRWRGVEVERHNNQFIVQASGAMTHNRILEQIRYQYDPPQSRNAVHPGKLLSAFARTLSPVRSAGNSLLIREKAGDAGRDAWYYNAKLRRAYRVAGLQYDIPYPDTDGHQHFDQVDMFNGELDRFEWKLVGRKELYLPYNSNRLAGRSVKYADMIRPRHLNQDLPRYELHRYWIVDATLKTGERHTYKRRRFYVDEDSWNIEAIDNYDAAGTLIGFQEGHLVHFASSGITTTAPQVIYNLAKGSYFVTQAFNEDAPPNFAAKFSGNYFAAESMTRIAER